MNGKLGRNIVGLSLISALLAACVAPGGYANIRPRWTIRNAPIPVPRPTVKPTPPIKNATITRVSARPPAQNRGVSTTVRRGDTLYAIARTHHVEVRDLIRANGLKPPYTLYPGQRLTLPGGQRFHIVRKGDTGYGISRQYNVDVTMLMRINDIGPPYQLSPGQRLRLPGSVVSTSVKNKSQISEPKRVKSTPRTGALVNATTEIKASKSVSAGGFQWPVEGRVISTYGAKSNGLHNDGINIEVRQGEQVRAARDGVVAYADNGFKGFGNILLIRHSYGWVTAYAHNERLLVSKGQKVERGQVIARAGATGSVNRPQLHFEIREGRDARNPLSLLPKK